MNLVAERFKQLGDTRRKALIPYIMGGYPDLRSTVKQLEKLASYGADLIEVGIPFSDPLADGALIQAAGQQALQNGCTLGKLMETIKPVLRDLNLPVLTMVYYNMIFQRGVRRFLETLKCNGCAGVIIPDLPAEEAEELREAGMEFELALNFLVAPTSTPARIEKAAEATTGFIYAVSLNGVTGARDRLPEKLPEFIAGIRKITPKPVAVGFGISQPWQAREISSYADGVVVGSAVLQRIMADSSLEEMGRFVNQLRQSLDDR